MFRVSSSDLRVLTLPPNKIHASFFFLEPPRAGDHGRLHEGEGEGVVPQEGERSRGSVPLNSGGESTAIPYKRTQQRRSAPVDYEER